MSLTVSKQPSSQRPLTKGGSSSPIAVPQRAMSSSPHSFHRPSPPDSRPQESQAVLPRVHVKMDTKLKRAQGHSRPSSIGGISDGIGNLNRWSQSTSSSKSSATNQQRRNSFARRLSGSFSSIGGYNGSQSPTNTKNVLKKVNPSPASSPKRITQVPPPKPQESIRSGPLPPLVTLPILSQAIDAAHTPLSAATATSSATDFLPSATYMPGNGDFFGDSWSQIPTPNPLSNNVSEPVASYSRSNSANTQINPGAKNSFVTSYSSRTEPPQVQRQPSHSNSKDPDLPFSPYPQKMEHSSNGGTSVKNEDLNSQRERGRRRKAPSQKAMLSKALQKANHAVVLDNAQNFEGAMDAYGDACDLLKQVMLRSSGDEDKKKLDAIVCSYRYCSQTATNF